MKIDASQLAYILGRTRENVYVVDAETHELLYANKCADEQSIVDFPEGISCYKAMHDSSEKCPWCVIPQMEDGEAHLAEVNISGTRIWLQIDAYEVDWNGRRAALVYNTDITKQKQQSQMFENAFGEAKLVLWEYLIADHRVIMSDFEFTRSDYPQFGIKKVIENAPQSLVPSIADDSVDAFLNMYREIDEGAPKASCEVWYKLKPGMEPRCMRLSLTNEFGADGKPVRALGLGQNITEEKNAQDKFDKAYEQIDNPNSYGSFHLNLTQNWCGEGRRGKSRMKGVLDLQNSGTVDGYFDAFAALIADEDVKTEFYKHFDRELLLGQYDQGVERISIEYPVVHDDGLRHWREGFLSMMKNPTTGDIEAFTYSLDIDSRKRDECIIDLLTLDDLDYFGLIHPTTRTFELLGKGTYDSIVEIGETVDYEDSCKAAVKGFVNEHDRTRMEEATLLQNVLDALSEKGSLALVYTYGEGDLQRRKQLRYRWLEVEGGDILVTQADITSEYEQEQERMRQLQKAVDDAEQANQAEQAFLSSMSHDMRTPLSGIIGFTDLAMGTDDAARKQEYLDKIQSSGNLMLDLVNDVLDMSKIESGKLELRPQAIDAKSTFEAVFESLRLAAANRGISLLIDFDEDYPRYILVDRLRLQQIGLNLLSNAVKYTPDNGTVSFVVRRWNEDGDECNTLIRVSDNGIGMSKEFQTRMFEAFAQEHQSRMYGTQGTGLGLSIVKRVVDLMGGRIEVESELGKGSVFSVYLPIESVEIGQAIDDGSRRKATSIAGMRILICEDNELNAEIAETIIRERGKAEPDLAINGKIGLEKFAESAPGHYDAVLMDLRMPVMNGIDAAKAIRDLDRADAQSVPIIAMTADAFEEDVQRCLDAGMNAHVAKPINPDRLFEVLGECRLGS